jgi:dTDP-4-amino-4,6-dideoxygalactose transaminase
MKLNESELIGEVESTKQHGKKRKMVDAKYAIISGGFKSKIKLGW